MQVEEIKIIDIINKSVDFFKKKKIESPRLNIELILTSLFDCSRIDLYLMYDKPIKEQELKIIRDMVSRRANNEPIQYITNKANFLDFEFEVNKDTLIPRPETEQLTQIIIDEWTNKPNLKILDIGTGSGCIAITLSKKLKCSVKAIDNSINSLDIALSNSAKYHINIDFEKLDILKELPKGKFDIIVSNPPYISNIEYDLLEKDVKDFEPKNALCDLSDGLTYYRRFNDIFVSLLEKNGKFYLEFGYNQANDVKNIFERNFKVNVLKDFAAIERFCVGEFY